MIDTSLSTSRVEVTRRTPSDSPLREACPPTARSHRRPAQGDPEKSPPCRDYRRLQPSVPHHLITLRPAPSHWVVRLQSGFPRDAYVGLVRGNMSYDVNTPSDDFGDDLVPDGPMSSLSGQIIVEVVRRGIYVVRHISPY